MGRPTAAGIGLLFLLAAAGFGNHAAERNNLIGKWREGDSGKNQGEIWSLEPNGDAIRVTRSLKQRTEEFECNAMDRDCDVTLSGRRARWRFGSTAVPWWSSRREGRM